MESKNNKLKNECPICHQTFGDVMFESHVDVCLKEQFIDEASREVDKAADLTPLLSVQAEEVDLCLQDCFSRLDTLDAQVKKDIISSKLLTHLSTTVNNAANRLMSIYSKLGLPLKVDGSVEKKSVVNVADDGVRSEHSLKLRRAQFKRDSTCSHCKKMLGPEKVMLISECGHRLDEICTREALEGVLKSGRVSSSDLRCPVDGCKARIPDQLCKKVLSEADHNKILEISLKTYMAEAKEQFIKCPNAKCGNAFLAVAGQIPNANKEEIVDGKKLSAEANVHRANNRYRCATCSTIFCAGCSLIPYHLGYTCEQYKDFVNAKACRFCRTVLTPATTAKAIPDAKSLDHVCTKEECLAKRDLTCTKTLACGHPCCGVRGESPCLPCLQDECAAAIDGGKSNAYCNICWVDYLPQAPTILLRCNHLFHYQCVLDRLQRKWPGPAISFGFLKCPLCKTTIAHRLLEVAMLPLLRLQMEVKTRALVRLRSEGMDKDQELTDPSSRYYKDPASYALDRFAFYECFKCKSSYFGGKRACEDAVRGDDAKFKPEDLVCSKCSATVALVQCPKHGVDFMEYKCKFCCRVAAYFCWGSTHFCASCHKTQEGGVYLNRKPRSELPACPGPGKCPLGVAHPPNGEEFALGCAVCRK